MSDMIFVKNEKLTKEYQRSFNEPGIIGYYRFLSEPEPEQKYYYLFLENTCRRMLVGGTLASVSIRLEDMYLRKKNWDFLKPYPTLAELERDMEKIERRQKRSQKRLDLIKQVSMIKSWGRGVIAKIAANLDRTIGAVRSMLSVLTKEGLLVRIRRGQYSTVNY
ncbi:MAG: hypothetical protein ABFS56_27860 [Pseudomonadota bacterium]